jgi:hypothetical protein
MAHQLRLVSPLTDPDPTGLYKQYSVGTQGGEGSPATA